MTIRKQRLYLLYLWVATCSLLLSTVVLHHHHLNRICLVEERCQEDGNVNDEHTEHHENEQNGCSVHQMHQFVVNAKIVKSIHQHILDGGHVLFAWLPQEAYTFMRLDLVISQWQEQTSPLHEGKSAFCKRRGPPCLS